MKFEYDSEEMKMGDNNEKHEGRKHSSDIPVKEIGELLDEVSMKLPKLLEGIQKSYYSLENGTNAGKSVGAFYKELIASGISQDMAQRLTERFMVSIKDISGIVHKDN